MLLPQRRRRRLWLVDMQAGQGAADGQFRAPFKSPTTTTTPTLLMGGCGTAENLPGGIPSGCTCVSQATPWPFLTHLRSSEELEGASSYASNVLRRFSLLNHLSLLPFHEASPSRRTPVQYHARRLLGSRVTGHRSGSCAPVCSSSGLRRPGRDPRPPACEAAAEG